MSGKIDRCRNCGAPHREGDCEVLREGEAKAKQWGPAFVDSHRIELARIITTYADDEAKAIGEHLRARFWGMNPEEWTKAERGEKH